MRLLMSAILIACCTLTAVATSRATLAPVDALGITVTADPIYAIPTRPDRAGRLLAPVAIDGHGPFRFLVDTGCNGTMIGDRLALTLGYEGGDGAGMIRVHDVLGPMLMPALRLGEINLGLFTATGITAPILSIRDASGADGVLGTNSLAGRRLWVDFERDQIRIERSKRTPPSGHDTIKGRLHADGLLVVPVNIGGLTVPGLVDTGAERSLINPSLLARLMERGRAAPIGEVTVMNLSGLEAKGPVFLLPRVRLGPIAIRNLASVLVDAHAFDTLGLADEPAIVLGMDILGLSRSFAIDFQKAELHIRLPKG